MLSSERCLHPDPEKAKSTGLSFLSPKQKRHKEVAPIERSLGSVLQTENVSKQTHELGLRPPSLSCCVRGMASWRPAALSPLHTLESHIPS